MDKVDFVNELAKLRPSSTFLSVKGYCNKANEVANYSIVFNMSYQNALERSIQTLEGISPTDPLTKRAKQELLSSFNKSIQYLPSEDDETYHSLYNQEGNPIKGIKVHTRTGNLHLYGLVVHKKVIEPGTYPADKRRKLTIAKDKLRQMCSVGKFRQFIISPDCVESISVQGMNLIPS